MAEKTQLNQSWDWGAVTTFSEDLRARELVDRVRWFITMRWLAVLAGLGGVVAARFNLVPARLNPVYFVAVAIFLAVANMVYAVASKRVLGDKPDHRGVQVLLVVQMFGDFVALSVLTYTCGSIETPILTLFLAHIILATLFFGRVMSLTITGAAFLFATLPLILEWAGWIPTLSIFDGHFKRLVTSNTLITGGFLVGIGAVFFVCWYLVSEITGSLKLRERQVEDAYDILVRMDKEKTQASVRATHELKAPFAAIKSYIYTLRDGYCGELPEKAQKVVNRIGQRCDQLAAKITDIIHLSNLRTLVVTDMDLPPVDIIDLIKEEAAEAALTAEPRKIQVVNHAAEMEPVYVQGSREHLHTLLSNLIQNALRYSHDGGSVELSVRKRKTRRRVSVRVLDHGIGIPKENLDKIFTEHFRSNNAVAHDPNGTGLGLAMIKEIVRLHGARIRVESELGKQTHFTVSFDTTEPEPEETQKQGDPKHGGDDGQDSDH